MGPTPARLANFRDVAVAVAGLRPGVLLRSDAPHSTDVPPDGVTVWPPRTVIDLRDTAEPRESHPFGATSTVLPVPLFEGGAAAPHRLPPTLTGLFLSMLAAPAAPRVVEAVTAIARSEGPVLVHCTAGKDRTGVTVATALVLAGVPREHIVADFVLTAAGMPGVLARLPMTATFATPAVHDEGVPDEPPAALPVELFTAPAYAVEAVLDAFTEHDGGALGWFLAHGGDPAVPAELRTRLLA